MKLTPISIDEIPGKKLYRTKLSSMLDEFSRMDADAVEIDWKAEGYSKAKVAVSSISVAIKKSGCRMLVLNRNNRVFLIKKK